MYVHGGGFVSGSPDSVSPYLLQLCIELHTRGLVADILAVKYDLAPEHPYPQALRQVVAAYEYALTQSNPIVLLGDSAGGNLCLALLLHLDKPHPMISPSYARPPGDRGIVATCLTSPWVDLRNESESYRKDTGMDCLDKSALDSWRDAYLGSHPLDDYVCPVDCKVGWKDILPSNTLLMSGDLDLFSADIRRLARNIELVSPGDQRHITPFDLLANNSAGRIPSSRCRHCPSQGSCLECCRLWREKTSTGVTGGPERGAGRRALPGGLDCQALPSVK